MNKLSLLIVTAAFVLLSVGCSMLKVKGKAEPAIERFHQQFNDKKFHEIYTEADAKMKEKNPELGFTNYLELVRHDLGTFKKGTQTSSSVKYIPELGTTATLVYESEFSDGKAKEVFMYHVDGDNATFFSYNIDFHR